MKSCLLTLFLTLFFSSIFSQHETIDLSRVYQSATMLKSLDTITYLLQLDSTQISDYEKAELFSMRGLLRLKFNKKDIKRRRAANHPAFKSALQDFSSAVNQNGDKSDKLKYTYRRFVSLKKYKPHYSNYQADLNLIKSRGYKKDNFGMAIFAKSKYDGELWLGVEFSIRSGYRPSYRLKGYEGHTIKKKNQFSASVLTFGYSQNIQTTALSDLSISLVRIESPIFIDILQFGFIDTSVKNYWYYRPEVGVGYSIFQLSGGYNLFFNSDEKSKSLSKAMVNFRIKFIF